MKKLIYTLCLLATSSVVFATSVLKRPLAELVAEADCIVMGTIWKEAMYDENGKEVKNPSAQTGPGQKNEWRYFIKVDQDGILKSNVGKIPDDIVIVLYKGHISTRGPDENLGPHEHPNIFILRANPFREVHPRDCIRVHFDRPMIEDLIRETKKAPNQAPQPTPRSGVAEP